MLASADLDLRSLLDERRDRDPQGFSARTAPRSHGGCELYQYPAMMVSSMQGILLEAVVDQRGGQPVVYDAFVGSGTTLVEAVRLGCPFVGCDINPLAVLLCQVNTGEAAGLDVEQAVGCVAGQARGDQRKATETGPWLQKWFRPDVADRLSALRRAIRTEPDIRVRRLLWVSLSEVVRVSGNMRLSTPKLQTRPQHDLQRAIDPVSAFVRTAEANAAKIRRQAAALPRQPDVWLTRADTRSHRWPDRCEPAGVLITSPPYGDNHTTMPYGQHSFLPSKWIDLADIDDDLNPDLLSTSKTLDTRSLGGSRRIDADKVARAAERSGSLRTLLIDLADEREPWQRVAAFFVDLDQAFAAALSHCAPDAHLVLTVGDRTVARRHVNTTAIISELLQSRGAAPVAGYERSIHRNKRMARRNEYASTISSERVLIMRRYES